MDFIVSADTIYYFKIQKLIFSTFMWFHMKNNVMVVSRISIIQFIAILPNEFIYTDKFLINKKLSIVLSY